MTKAKITWTILRSLGFIIIGLMNTVLLKAEDIGTWKNYVGLAFLVLAVIDIFYLTKSLRRKNNKTHESN